jgi:hypothetical protein
MAPFRGEPFRCVKLRKTIALLDDVQALGGPLGVSDDLIEKWTVLLAERNTSALSWKEIRNLCWEPKIATQPEFLDLIEVNQKALSSSAIQGLIFSYHSEYTGTSSNSRLEEFLRLLIEERGQYVPSLAVWRTQIDALVGGAASENMSERITRPGVSFTQSFETFRIYPNTSFASHAANRSIYRYVNLFSSMNVDSIEHFYKEIITAPIIGRDTFKAVISRLILNPIHEQNEDLRTRLLAYIITNSGLRDPRIQIEGWIGIDEQARQRVIQWLSSQDIDFFFGLLIGREDPHRRRSFWMGYVSKVYRSRALLCTRDRDTYQRQLRELETRGTSYGNLKSAPSSAFILDFGKLVVVEFSTVGRVYLYTPSVFNRIMPNFWSRECTSTALKNPELAIESITHHRHNPELWQDKVRNIMSRYGVRR